MPTFKVTTKKSRVVWTSPDGQRVLSEVTLDVDGAGEAIAKTYSEAIARMGWEGEVETSEKENNKGEIETFVKQPQKENNYRGGGGGKTPYVPRDDASIKAQMAIKTAVAMGGVVDITNQKDTASYLEGVENAAREIFSMIDRVKNSTESAGDGELTKEALNAVFGDDENFTVEGEKAVDPWKTKP